MVSHAGKIIAAQTDVTATLLESIRSMHDDFSLRRENNMQLIFLSLHAWQRQIAAKSNIMLVRCK